MANFNNDLSEKLETRKLIILQEGNIFKFQTKEEELEYVKKTNYSLQKHYTFHGDDEIIINLDFDTIKPFTRYCLKDVFKSLEYKATIFNRIIIFVLLFFALFNIFLNFSAKSQITELLKQNPTKTTQSIINPGQVQKNPSQNVSKSQYDIIQEFENKNTLEPKNDNKGGGTIYYGR